MRRSVWLLFCSFAWVTSAFATEQYTITTSPTGDSYSTTGFRQDLVIADYATSNGTGSYAGHAYAGPGWVKGSCELDCTWSSGFSGGNSGWLRSRAQTDDFVISGPPGYVTGTLHWRLRASLSLAGGYPGSGGHQDHVVASVSINYLTWNGSVTYSNYGVVGDNAFAGYGSPEVDAPISITGSFPTNTPLLVYMYVECSGATYGNSTYNPGVALCDAGGQADDHSGRGLRLEQVNGQVMTLPAGYTLDSPAWGVVDNTFPHLAGVADPRPGDVRLRLAGANPTVGDVRLALTLPRDGAVRLAIHDVTGRTVMTLFDGPMGAGAHDLVWDGRREDGAAAPAGVYFVRGEVDGRAVATRVVKLR